MDEALLAGRARGGDLDSFGQLYDRYFHRVYDFTWRVMRDADAAADATRDIFLRAMRELPSLPKSQSFASWLFTMAHHTAVARAERTRATGAASALHEEAFGSFEVPDASRLLRPAIAGGDHELAALVWDAVMALNARDYALLDLHVRQGLDSAELAHVLDVSAGTAAAIVTRMRAAAEGVITGYIVARRGSSSCPALQELLASVNFPPYADDVRRAVDVHIRTCATCQAQRKAIGAAPLDVLGAFAPVAAPMAVKGDLWRALSEGWSASRAGAAGLVAGDLRDRSPYGAAGGLTAAAAGGIGLTSLGGGSGGGGGGAWAAGAGDWERNRVLLFAGGAAALLIIAFAGAAALYNALGGGDSGGGSGGAIGATRTAAATRTATAAGTPPGVFVPTATPNLTPSATVEATATATATAEATERPADTAVPATVTPVPRRTPTKPATTATAGANPTKTPNGCSLTGCPTPVPSP